MPLKYPNSGPNWTSEYMMSPTPWVTSSVCNGVRRIEFSDPLVPHVSSTLFNYVTKWIVVSNESTNVLRVGFTEYGLMTGSKYIELELDEALSVDLRCSELWISGSGNSFQIIAGLTGITAYDEEFPLTSSKGYPGVG